MKPEKEKNILRAASLVAATILAGSGIAGAGVMITERYNNFHNRIASDQPTLPSVSALDQTTSKGTENINSVRKELVLVEKQIVTDKPFQKGMTVFGIGAGLSLILALAIGIRKRQINARETSTPSDS
ncbi:MAG: hypothetical protein AAB662_03410 [Patescibacteria group bacterium]